jgi:DNA polymerase III delta prime subunit
MSDPFVPVVGHVQICELLRRVLSHPGNAYLFFGPAQIGKQFVAERFAAALLDHPFDRALESHPDFIRVRREAEAKEIVIKQARELIQRVSFSASRGGRTVVLIEEADFLNEEAANALLKIVEEPSVHITYLFWPNVRSSYRQPVHDWRFFRSNGFLKPCLFLGCAPWAPKRSRPKKQRAGRMGAPDSQNSC